MSLVAFKARNHPQQATCDRVDDRLTARFLAGRLRFGMPAGDRKKGDRPPFGCALLTWLRPAQREERP